MMRQGCEQQCVETFSPPLEQILKSELVEDVLLLDAIEGLRYMPHPGRPIGRQIEVIPNLELKAGVDLGEVVEERRDGQPADRDAVQRVGAPGGMREPRCEHAVGDENLETRRYVSAVVLEAMERFVSVVVVVLAPRG